ncbi:MAG: Gx transporter family protein [Clostridia bacterium]|nr:Gx transporter family protein [Clostridia bacterium]
MKKPQVRKVALSGIFCALAMAISFLESLIPPLVPVPGIKPGFSNIVTMFCLDSLGFPYAFAVTLFKASFALITRGVTAFFMSLFGGIASLMVTTLLFRLKEKYIGCMGIGVLAAVAHNCGQLAVAVAILGHTILTISPVLIISGVASGLITGTVFYYTVPVLKKHIKLSDKGSIKKC